jgi:hypothetical protein
MSDQSPIYVFNKPRARQRIEIFVDLSMDKDGWFYDVRYIEKKSGKLAHSHCVIKKDIENWIQSFKNEGWNLETN